MGPMTATVEYLVKRINHDPYHLFHGDLGLIFLLFGYIRLYKEVLVYSRYVDAKDKALSYSLIALSALYHTSSTLFLAIQNPYTDGARHQPLTLSSPFQSRDSRAPPNPCIRIVHPPNRSFQSLPCTFRWGTGSCPPCSRSPRRVPSRSAAREYVFRLAWSRNARKCST